MQSTTEGESRQPTSPEFHGVLSRITYPNGGYTDFTFENHRFLTASGADGDIVFDRRNQRIVEGGGFRIKSIINYTAEGKIASEDHYRYGYTYGDIEQSNLQFPLPATYNKKEHIGCGEAVVDPNLLTFMTYSYYDLKKESYRTYNGFRDMIVGIENNFETNIIDIQGKATWWDAYFSANTFRGLLGGRRPIVYPEITVYHGNPDDLTKCISKSVYKYDIYSTHHDQYTHYLLSFDKAVKPNMAYFERIYYVGDVPGLICDDSEAAKRNRLESKSDFSYNAISNSWDLVSEEEYSYIKESISKSGNVFNSSLSRECRTSYAGELDNKQWLDGVSLQSLYQQVTQYFGRSTMTGKSVTTLRKGGTRTYGNTLTENYSYLYSGVMSSRSYTDVYDKVDSYSFVGQDEYGTNPIITEMKSRNMLASLITAETWPEDIPSVVSGSKIDYASYGGRILPSRLYERNGDNYEASIEVISYDSYGNPTEIVDLKTGNKDNGIHSVFVWDTYGRYLIALIKNAKLSQVQNATSQLSTGTSQSRFNTLKSLLPNAQIQTWAYKPLIGVTSHTDINGQTLLYEYDGLGRLKTVKRVVNGSTAPEIINEYEYNYKNTSL